MIWSRRVWAIWTGQLHWCCIDFSYSAIIFELFLYESCTNCQPSWSSSFLHDSLAFSSNYFYYSLRIPSWSLLRDSPRLFFKPIPFFSQLWGVWGRNICEWKRLAYDFPLLWTFDLQGDWFFCWLFPSNFCWGRDTWCWKCSSWSDPPWQPVRLDSSWRTN